jgi:hypothetical protein
MNYEKLNQVTKYLTVLADTEPEVIRHLIEPEMVEKINRLTRDLVGNKSQQPTKAKHKKKGFKSESFCLNAY